MPIHGFGDLPAVVSLGGDDIDLGEDAQASLYLIGALAYEGLRRFIEPFRPIAPTLTEQELRVLRWTAEGKSAESIAVLVDLSPYTVREYHARLRAKYAVATMIQAVVLASLDGNLQIASQFAT
jgi:DNA-binding CsgD family transcriptional regulator